MELVRWEPFERLNRLGDLLDEAFGLVTTGFAGDWNPPVDILESKDAYLIQADIPGMKLEDLNVEVHERSLMLSGERKRASAEGIEYHHLERPSGKFSRRFYLPENARTDAIQATYRDGVLEICVPKVEKARPRQIEVTVH
ncbi:MAG TPA: Hsp20/alpha crystallin family protein [candidate division Zixibacteria bacterium]|nr:Hsp20/alpha crystallin family protein [candidate division Zixibacteria bacterium]